MLDARRNRRIHAVWFTRERSTREMAFPVLGIFGKIREMSTGHFSTKGNIVMFL